VKLTFSNYLNLLDLTVREEVKEMGQHVQKMIEDISH